MAKLIEVIVQKAKPIADNNDSDFFLYCGGIEDESADVFIKLLRDKPNKRANCSLILTTDGGDPDAGYRMVRAIKRHYKNGKFILYLYGRCKSAGTLIALGCDEIVMSDFGELGPLDVQLIKDDEFLNTSGLSYLQSLISLNKQMFASFESNFLMLKAKSGSAITTKTAMEIGSKLAIGLIAPISEQLDPVKLGEVERAIRIAASYGSRICKNEGIVTKLIRDYPSHSFVIDFEEAKDIFDNVRFVKPEEIDLERAILDLVRHQGDGTMCFDIFDLVQTNENENQETFDEMPVVEEKSSNFEENTNQQTSENKNENSKSITARKNK